MSRFNEKISAIDRIEVSAFTIPESDGTFEWDSTTPILVETYGGRGLRELRGWARNIFI